MQNFLGDFECTLDSKGRLMVPARFRHQVPEAGGDIYVITMGKEHCLNLWPIIEWNEEVVSKLHELPAGPEKRQLIRFYSRKSRNINLDKSGRVAIPSTFLEAIGNPKKVIVVGALNYIEVWAPDEFEKASAMGDEAYLDSEFEI